MITIAYLLTLTIHELVDTCV